MFAEVMILLGATRNNERTGTSARYAHTEAQTYKRIV